MKRNFYLFFILFSGFCFSQTYQFNTLTKYSSKSSLSKKTTDFVNYFNTSDFTYTLSLAKSDTRFVALLFDRGRKLTHYFTVIESKDKGEIKFQFRYESSMKNYLSKVKTNYRYEFSESSESSPKEVTLKIFRNKKSKKPIVEQQLTLQNSDQNLFPIYQNTLLAHYPSKPVLSGNFMVSKAVETCVKCACETNLMEMKNTSLEIKLPEDLKFPGNFYN